MNPDQIMDAALAAPLGIRVETPTLRTAQLLRWKLYHRRTRERAANAKIDGTSGCDWDGLDIGIDGTALVIRPTSRLVTSITPITPPP